MSSPAENKAELVASLLVYVRIYILYIYLIKLPFCHWLFSSSRQPTRLFFFFIGHRRRCRPDRPPSQKDIKYCLSGPSVSVSLFRFLVLFLAACAAASRSTASVVCLCAVRWPRQHTQWVAEAKKEKKRSGSRFTMTCHPRQPSVTRRMVVSSVIIALAHTRGAHSTARHTQLTYRKSPALLYLTEWLVSPRRYPHNSFEAFFHFQFGLISTPNSDQKLFPPTH